MTSKEALKEIKDYTLVTYDEDCYEENCIEFGELEPNLIEAIENDLVVLECFKKYFDFELVFENNQTYLIFKSKERYLPVDSKLSISNKYYEPLNRWLENEA